MIGEVLLYLVSFLVFSVLQAMMINGVHESFTGEKLAPDIKGETPVPYQGMIFYMMAPKFFERNKNKYWAKPLWVCVKCMASVWGAVTYWPVVIWLFGFRWIEIFVFCGDVFILVYLNFLFYKRQ